jgi:flavodoxin
MITSEGDAVVSFKVRGNVDLYFGVPQKNNPQSMSTNLGLPDVANDSYKIDVWEQSVSGAFDGDPVSYENGTDNQAEIQDTEWKSRLKISLNGDSVETRYIYVRGGYGSDGERKLCFPEVNFTKFANNSFLNPHRTIIVNKNPETGNLSFTTEDDPTGFDLREAHDLKLVSGNDYKFRKATDTFKFVVGTKTLSHESDSTVTANADVNWDMEDQAQTGVFVVGTLDSEIDPTLSNFWDMKTVNFMASPNLKDTYTYDNIYKIEINDNFIIHGKGDFAYRKNLYNIAGYETNVVKKPTSNSLLFTFAGCMNLTNSDIVENLDVSDVTSMNGAFMNTLKLDVTLWQWQSLNNNTGLANLTSARRMFYGSGFNRSLGTWKPVALKNAERMFSYSKFNQETIITWALNLTTALNNVSHMFSFSRMNQPMNDFDAVINGCDGLDTMFLYTDMSKGNLPNNVLLESTLEDVSTTFNFDSATIQLSSTGSPSVTLNNLTFNSQGFLPGWMDIDVPVGGGFQVVIAKQSDKNTSKQRYFPDGNVLGFSTGGYINEDTKSLFNSWTDLKKVENTDNITFTGFANLVDVDLKEESFLNWQNEEPLEIGILFAKSEGLNIVPLGDVKINNVTVRPAPTPTPTVTHTNTFDDFKFAVEGVNIVDTLTITTDTDDVSADLSEINPLFNSNTLQHIHIKELDEKHIARVRFDGVASLNSTDKWKYKIKFANGTVMSEWKLVENGFTQSLSQGDRVFLYLDYSDLKKNSEFQFRFNVEKQKIGENSWQSGGDGLGRVEVKYNVVYNPPTPTPTPTATKSKTPTKTPTKTQESVDFNSIASQMQNSTDRNNDYSDVTGTIVYVDLANGFYGIEIPDLEDKIVSVNLQSELENNVGKTIVFSGFSDNNFVDLFMWGTAVFIENHRIMEPVGTGFDFMGLELLVTVSDTETELPTFLSVTSFDENKLTAKYNSNHDLTIDLKIVREDYSGRPADTTESDVFGQLTANDVSDGSGWNLIRGFDDRFGMFQDNVGGLHNLIRAINAGSLSDYNPSNNEAEFSFFSQSGDDYSTFLNGSDGIKLAVVLSKWDDSIGMTTILEEHFVEVIIQEGNPGGGSETINLSEILLKDNVEFRASFGSVSDNSASEGELYLENLSIDFDKVSESFKENWDLNNYDLYYMVVDSTLDHSITDELYDFFKEGNLIQNSDGIFAFGRSTFNSTSSDAKFTFRNNMNETIDDVFVEGENYVGTLLKVKNEMNNKVHSNITDFIDTLSEDAEIRFVLVNNDDNFEGESRFISSAKYSMNLQAYYPQYIYVENVQFVMGEESPDGFGVFEVQSEKGNFHDNQTLRYYTSVFGSKKYAIYYENNSSQWRFWDHPSINNGLPALNITSDSLEFSDNWISVSLEVPASAWNTPTPTRTRTKTPTSSSASPLTSDDLGYFVIGKFETHEGVEIATTGIYDYHSSFNEGSQYVYTFKSNIDDHVLKVHYIDYSGSDPSFFNKNYGGGDSEYMLTLHTSESSSEDLIATFVGSDKTGTIEESKSFIRANVMDGVLFMGYVGKNTKRNELHPTETNIIDFSDEYGWSLNHLPILGPNDPVLINSGVYSILPTFNGGDAWVRLENDIDMTLKTQLYQGNPLGLGPSNYDDATDTFFGFLALAINTFNSNTTFLFNKFLRGNKTNIGTTNRVGFQFTCSSEVPPGAVDVELPEDLSPAPVSDSDLGMHLMSIQKDIVVGNGSPSDPKFIGGVFDIDDLSPSHISNENLVPISKMNIQDGVLNAFTSGDWEWWGKFIGADANIADKVYIIDINSSSTDLLSFKPQLFNNESDFMNNNRSNYSQ